MRVRLIVRHLLAPFFLSSTRDYSYKSLQNYKYTLTINCSSATNSIYIKRYLKCESTDTTFYQLISMYIIGLYVAQNGEVWPFLNPHTSCFWNEGGRICYDAQGSKREKRVWFCFDEYIAAYEMTVEWCVHQGSFNNNFIAILLMRGFRNNRVRTCVGMYCIFLEGSTSLPYRGGNGAHRCAVCPCACPARCGGWLVGRLGSRRACSAWLNGWAGGRVWFPACSRTGRARLAGNGRIGCFWLA